MCTRISEACWGTERCFSRIHFEHEVLEAIKQFDKTKKEVISNSEITPKTDGTGRLVETGRASTIFNIVKLCDECRAKQSVRTSFVG